MAHITAMHDGMTQHKTDEWDNMTRITTMHDGMAQHGHWVWFFPSCNFSTATARFFPSLTSRIFKFTFLLTSHIFKFTFSLSSLYIKLTLIVTVIQFCSFIRIALIVVTLYFTHHRSCKHQHHDIITIIAAARSHE